MRYKNCSLLNAALRRSDRLALVVAGALGACGERPPNATPLITTPVTFTSEWEAPARFVARATFLARAQPAWEVKDCTLATWRPLVADGEERGIRFAREATCGVRVVDATGLAPNDVFVHRSPRSILDSVPSDLSDAQRMVLSDGDLGTGYQLRSLTVRFRQGQRLSAIYVAVHEPAIQVDRGATIHYEPRPKTQFNIAIFGVHNRENVVRKLDSQLDFPTRYRYFLVPFDEVRELTFTSDSPVDVRELQLLDVEDKPIVTPWVLSVNANPSEQVASEEGHGVVNDRYHASFLTKSFRRIGWYPKIELVRGDDPSALTWIDESYPKPIVILSGSNAWDYATTTKRDPSGSARWMYNPLLPPSESGMGHFQPLVRQQRAPLLGLCGGGQILALLRECDPKQIEQCYQKWLRRTTGEPIEGLWRPSHVIRAWPGDPSARVAVEYDPLDPLWMSAGDTGRRLTRGLPESHVDALAFEPLRAHWDVSAASHPCARGRCTTIPEVFAIAPAPFSVIGTQFHPEAPMFAPGEVPDDERTDPARFMSAVLEQFALELIRNR